MVELNSDDSNTARVEEVELEEDPGDPHETTASEVFEALHLTHNDIVKGDEPDGSKGKKDVDKQDLPENLRASLG